MSELAAMFDLARFGDAPAIERADGALVTYRALAAMVEAARTSEVVRVVAERSVEFVARCLGAWRGGGAFVPVDPADPRAHPAIPHIDGLAYATTTSGSSGAPKHVLVGTRGIPALLRAQIAAFDLGPGARALWLHAPVFDASISDWGTVLASGACLVLPTARAIIDVRGEVRARAITHVDLPPSLLPQLAGTELRTIVLGGEPSDPARVRAAARHARVVVVYGPTEATVCSSLVVVDPARWERPLIGDPLPGITYRVIDGELYIGGDCLAFGYTDAAETARAFVPVDDMRMYRTGDRVEPTPHGLAFAGRTDRQVKVNGKRVDLDGIEAVLRRFVPNAAVVLRDGRLVAFVDRALDASDLRGAFPPYLTPRIVVGELARTPTGKIDRNALAVPVPAWPADPLARAWCQALGVERVDARRFSACGGDSLARLTLQAMTGLTVDGDPTFAELVASRGAPALTVAECERRGLALLSAGEPAPRADTATAVLVTGAAGLLGRAVVAALQARGREVIGLVRSHPTNGEVVGDVTRPNLGLDGATRARIATVIHCAATIQLGAGWDAHETNVRGTAEVAMLCGARKWHHISTLSVFVNTDRKAGRHDAHANPAPDALVYGGYAQSKVAAEAIARASGASIYRLGLLTGSPVDQRARTLRAIAKLGAVPAGFLDERFDETPVEYAAAAITALAALPRLDGTFHIAAPRGTRLGDVIGADIEELPHSVWRERADARASDDDIAMAIGAFSRRPDLDLFLATDADFAVEETLALLAARGVSR